MSHQENTSKNKAKLDKRDYIENLKKPMQLEESTDEKGKNRKYLQTTYLVKRLIGKELLQTLTK